MEEQQGFICSINSAVILIIIYGQISNSDAASTPASVQNIISGFLPSPVKYFTQDGRQSDQQAVENNVISITNTAAVDKPAEERGQDGRFGYPVTAAEMGYGGVPGIYTPYKIDLGGVLLGAIIGFGAVVVLPKLLHVISSPASTHPGYGRSVDEMTSGLVNIIDRVDFALHEQNINSTVCLERAFCQLLQSSSSNSITASLMGNTLLMSMIEGSRIKTILEHSRSPNGCDNLVMRCPLNQEVLTNGIRAIINI